MNKTYSPTQVKDPYLVTENDISPDDEIYRILKEVRLNGQRGLADLFPDKFPWD